jgi:hypothetical protein
MIIDQGKRSPSANRIGLFASYKTHSFRQDLQDYQDFFGLVSLYPVNLVDPVRKWKVYTVKFSIRSNWPLFRPTAGLKQFLLDDTSDRELTDLLSNHLVMVLFISIISRNEK